MSDGGNSLALSALCSFSAVHVAVKTRMLRLRGKHQKRTWSGLSSKEALPAGRDRLSTTLRAGSTAASTRLSVRLATVALLLAASVAALLAADRPTGLFFGPVPRWPVLTPGKQCPIQDSGIRHRCPCEPVWVSW